MFNNNSTWKKRTLFIVLFIIFITVVFSSCTDFFSDSLGKWAARDKSKLVPKVTVDNVDELITLAENDPDLSLEVLRKIQEAAAGSSDEDLAKLQAAALEAAANASGGASAILDGLGSLSSIDENSDVEKIVMDAINAMQNLGDTTAILSAILPPPPADPLHPENDEAFMAFANQASASDLALAAVLLVAGEVQRTEADSFEGIINNVGSSDSVKQAQAMAIVTILAEREDAISGPLFDALDGLGFFKNL